MLLFLDSITLYHANMFFTFEIDPKKNPKKGEA